MRIFRIFALLLPFALLPAAHCQTAHHATSSALCPVVYPLDQSSQHRGYHYIFYGNAFFINRDGYLITAAHVLSEFRNGGDPHILLRLANAPSRLVKVVVIATDPVHDVAILRAIPNPFDAHFQIAFLALAAENPKLGDPVFAAALRPSRLQDPHSFDTQQEDRSDAAILNYLSTPLDKGSSPTNLFLFSHEVLRGQSGAPILSADSQQVVGFVEGRWLHPTSLAPGSSLAAAASAARQSSMSAPPNFSNALATLGAAVPISYVLALLQLHRIAFSTEQIAPLGNR